MKYLCITSTAADEIASDRYLQNAEFEAGNCLYLFISGQDQDIRVNPHLRFMIQGDGAYILSAKGNSRDTALVIDLDEAKGIFSGTPSECVTVFQKVVKYAVKHWTGLKRSSYEWVLSGSTKTIIFPFPVSTRSSYRVAVEREPDAKRFERRQGNHLLVYKCGVTEGDGAKEDASVTNFRKALQGLQQAIMAAEAVGEAVVEERTVSSLAVTELEEQPRTLSPLINFEDWLPLLTTHQRAFIEAEWSVPHRLEGPAGTGKSLCLRLRAISVLRRAQRADKEHHSIFIVPSDEIRKQALEAFEWNDKDGFWKKDRHSSLQSLKVVTLQQLCADILQTDISESEFLDSDSMESKHTQLLYLNEVVEGFLKNDLPSYERMISPAFASYMRANDAWHISEMFQHEISVVIKGRCGEDIETYKQIARPKYGLPLSTDKDKVAAFHIYQKYQQKLAASHQFDIDDIVISTISQMDTPIWRRRRQRQGYDSIFVDEIHLFNINELSLLHYLTKNEHDFPISYAIDRSQAIGDTGWDEELFAETIAPGVRPEGGTRVNTVFRCSPDIVDVAFSVTASGATLFTNFDNPLEIASSSFTVQDEQKCESPILWLCPSDDMMVEFAFKRADAINQEINCGRGNILIIASDPSVLRDIRVYGEKSNKPMELLTKRGDVDLVAKAQRSSRFVVALPDYVGGLEFDAAILVGVDTGRVPPNGDGVNSESSSFLSYAAHNRLYVAITRARFRLEILANKVRGYSDLLKNAVHKELIEKREL